MDKEEGNIFSRAIKHREPKAIVSVILFLIFAIIFLVAFGYDAKKVGPSPDFSKTLFERPEMSFPAWTLMTWGNDSFTSQTACRVCQFVDPTELCSQGPTVPFTVTGTNNFNQPNRLKFNDGDIIKASQLQETFIECIPAIAGDGYGAVSFSDGRQRPIQWVADLRPGGEVFVAFENHTFTFISLKRTETEYSNGTHIMDYERINVNSVFAHHAGSVIRIFYGSYVTTKWTQNSSGAKKGDFWAFMGVVGGTAFLFYVLYLGIMFLLTTFIFTGSSPKGYQNL